jgi:glycosyltransferase involved in cell wall biosynthesis
MPKVTVLMPVYNGEKYLCEAIDSILNQTFTDFEFLIIDDGSTDKSLEIINSYQDSRIKVVQHKENLGVSEASNKGLTLAQGELIAKMDCDDISIPNRLQKQVNFLDNHHEITIVGSYVELIDSQSKALNHQYKYPLTHDDIVNAMLVSNPMAQPSVMFRCSEVLDIGGYQFKKEWNGVSTEDYDLWLRIAARGHKFANIPESLVYYRNHPNSSTQIAIANGRMCVGFNNCFYISGLDLFGCSSAELELLRNRKYLFSIVIFIKIAHHLSKSYGGTPIERLKSQSFILSMQTLTSKKDIISRLVIALLKEKPLISLIEEVILIFTQIINEISKINKKIFKNP